MRRTFVAQNGPVCSRRFPFCLPFHEQPNTPREQRNFIFLSGNHIGQFVDGFLEVREVFFKILHVLTF